MTRLTLAIAAAAFMTLGMALALGGVGLAIGPIIASFVMQAIAPVGLFIVTATFHGALAVTAFLRMKVRPVRDASGRVRFRAIGKEEFTRIAKP